MQNDKRLGFEKIEKETRNITFETTASNISSRNSKNIIDFYINVVQ